MDLFNECREIKEKFNRKFLWMSGSKILIRKMEKSKVYEINSRNELNKITLLLSHIESQSRSVNTILNDNTNTGTTNIV